VLMFHLKILLKIVLVKTLIADDPAIANGLVWRIARLKKPQY